jgi:hypothetical protein
MPKMTRKEQIKITKKDIKGLSAVQTRMALILLKINGYQNAREFIDGCKGNLGKLQG